MKKLPFEVLIIFHSEEGSGDNSRTISKQILGPKIYLAKDKESAKIMAVRDIDKEYIEDIDNLDIYIRNF